MQAVDLKPARSDTLLKLSDLSVVFDLGDSKTLALDNVNMKVRSDGHTIGVVGESGSGKTTLGMSIMDLIEKPGKIESGAVEYKGKNVLNMSESELRKYRWSEVAMVYQSAMNSLNPVKRITDPLVEVLQEHLGLPKGEARIRAAKMLADVGITADRLDAFPHELSGGMRQRVVIALALALSPKLLIADEPTSALDVVVQKQILALLKKEVKKSGLSLVFITHEISLLRDLVQDTAVMYAGEIVEFGPMEKVLYKPLHPYTEMLLETLVTLSTNPSVLDVTRKTKPVSKDLPVNACKYVESCKYAFERCRRERPRLIEVENGRWVACHKYH
ncbi:MAG: ABC transporter ATP-binding protein [Nitrososphaerales archaeon]